MPFWNGGVIRLYTCIFLLERYGESAFQHFEGFAAPKSGPEFFRNKNRTRFSQIPAFDRLKISKGGWLPNIPHLGLAVPSGLISMTTTYLEKSSLKNPKLDFRLTVLLLLDFKFYPLRVFDNLQSWFKGSSSPQGWGRRESQNWGPHQNLIALQP